MSNQSIENSKKVGLTCPWPWPAGWDGVPRLPTQEELSSLEETEVVRGHDTTVQATPVSMLRGVSKAAMQFVQGGMVSSEVYNERLKTCASCPHFIQNSKRCSQCGCYMAAKARLNGDPNQLCPKQKWRR